MRPKVGLDARFALGNRRGIGNYSIELFRAMAELNQDYDLVFYTDKEDLNTELSGLPYSCVKIIRPDLYPVWEQIVLPLALRRDRIDLFHAVGNTAPIILPEHTKLVITIHDVMYMKSHELLPMSTSWYQRLGRYYRRIVVPLAAKRANHLLTISEFSKTDILETIPTIHANKLSVTLQGLPRAFSSLPPPRPRRASAGWNTILSPPWGG